MPVFNLLTGEEIRSPPKFAYLRGFLIIHLSVYKPWNSTYNHFKYYHNTQWFTVPSSWISECLNLQYNAWIHLPEQDQQIALEAVLSVYS